MKKYELTDEKKQIAGRTLFRIRALKDFLDVKAGDLGGWIESENNLSHSSYSWVYNNAMVYGNAMVSDNARVFGNARVSDNAQVSGNARVSGGACVFDNARVSGDARVSGNAWIYGRGESVDEFAEAVRNRHGGNKFAKQYELAIELAKASIETRKEGE